MLIYNEAGYLFGDDDTFDTGRCQYPTERDPEQHTKGSSSIVSFFFLSKIVMGIHIAVSYAGQLTRSA